MCGIAGGVWQHGDQGLDAATLLRMTNALEHRGPDDAGHWYRDSHNNAFHQDQRPSPGVALGFRRLSIIDLSTGHQPLCNEDGSIQIVFKGEIYN